MVQSHVGKSRSTNLIHRNEAASFVLCVDMFKFLGVALDHTESAREVAFIKPVPRRESRTSGNVRKYQLRGRNLTCLEFFILLLACIACFYQLTSVCFGLWQWSTSRFASRTSSVTYDHQCVYRSWYWSSD